MDISISDSFGDSNSCRSCQNVSNGTDYSKKSNAFIYPRKSKLQLIIMECYEEILEQKLKSSEEIWSQSERVTHIECLFRSVKFRKDTLDIVEFFGNELKRGMYGTPPKIQIDQIRDSTLSCLRSFVIPLVLKLLRSVHALRKDDGMVTMPREVKGARIKQNDIEQWLKVIRERGYNFLGLCAHIQGEFSEQLGSSPINDAIMENLGRMEFRHVSKLIDLFLIPLLKYCPRELLGERILKLLPPLFNYYCGDILCSAWFDLLNRGQASYPHYFGYPQGSEESVKKLEYCILLDLTRKVSKLLGVLASLESNDALTCVDLQPVSTVKTAPMCDSKCASSNSVVGYALLNNCFGMLKMNLLGSWVDGEATSDAVPFFHALVQAAVATNNRNARRFIVDDMLPATIKRLCDDLPCAVQQTIRKLSSLLNSSKSKKASEDLLVLCEEIHKVYIQSQDFTAQDRDNENIGDQFKDWFTRQKEDLRKKAYCAVPAHFPVALWNWEFEDEFQRYLPTYIDILYEIDAMDDCQKYDYSCRSTLIENLRPEFRLKHDINISSDHHVWMIDKMMQRKIVAEYPKRRSHQMDKWLLKLITSKPYLKSSDERHSAMARLMEDVTTDAEPSHLDLRDAVDIFYNVILFSLEPQFHPLIRVDHMNFLTKIAHQFIFAEEINCYKPLEPKSDDFPVHLQPHSSSFIYRMKITSKYLKAREQVRLHQELDKYLALGELDDDICRLDFSQDNSVEEFSVKHLKSRQLGKLNSTLIRLSLQDRAHIVDMQRHIDTYSENLRIILANEVLKDCLEKLMNELEEKAFFDVDNDSTDWKKTCFTSLIQKFKGLVFKGHDCPQYVAVQGIMEYWRISKRSDKAAQVALEKDEAAQVALEKDVEVVCHRWKQNIAELWMDTRYYEESCYDFIRNPLKKILPREEKPQISKKKKKRRKEKPQNHGRPPTMVG